MFGNAVLVRTGRGARVTVLADRHGVFSSQLSVPLPDQTITLKRGYAGMLGSVAGKRFLFLDPHAEAYSGSIAGQQLTQMLGTVAGNRKLPTILAVLRSQIVGNKASDRVGGLWPSDHAGVVATVRVR